VSLKASGPGGTSAPKERADYIAFPPQSHFWAKNPAGGLAQSDPFAVNFSESSTGTVSGWEWDFGDGALNVTNNPNPSHGYTANGRFKVELKSKGSEEPGEDIRAEDSYIAIAPRADFEGGPGACLSQGGCTVGPSGVDVTFNNKSKCEGACVSYWEFGDVGDGSTREENGLGPVTYKYAGTSEVYTVRLTVTGPGGGDTMEKKNYIHVAPWADISPQKVTYIRKVTIDCGVVIEDTRLVPATVTFFDRSEPQPFIKTRAWSTGDSGASTQKTFTDSGSVSLTVTNARGQSDTATATVTKKVNTTVIPCPPPPPPPPMPIVS
jgi:PKD repeat protein